MAKEVEKKLSPSEKERNRQMAWEEYQHLESEIVKHSKTCSDIKFWSITTFGALLTIYFSKLNPLFDGKILLWLNLGITLIYWLLECIYRRFQNHPLTRKKLLENYLNNQAAYSTYRVPNSMLIFDKKNMSEEDKKLLEHRGFKSIKGRYRQKIFIWQLIIRFHISVLYLIQIISVSVLLIFCK